MQNAPSSAAEAALAPLGREHVAPPARPRPRRGLYDRVKSGFHAADDYSRLHDRHQFEDRRSGAPVLVAMLAGYKAELWPFVMPRLKAALPEADVCMISPGKRSEDLAALCRREGWSYLATRTNDVSLAQNVCFRLHDAASMIVKLDEDMFLLPDTITTLLAEYQRIKHAGMVDPGFVAPMIPLNGFCYRHLLEAFGLLEEYEAAFGRARIAASGLALHNDPDAGRWIWERTAPLQASADRLAALGRQHLPCPVQFSIGAILFERKFWEAIGYFAVRRHRILVGQNTLGGDEAYLCARAVELSRPAVVTTATMAGHFSFGPQYAALKNLLEQRPELFAA
jgi:hypothetical protein